MFSYLELTISDCSVASILYTKGVTFRLIIFILSKSILLNFYAELVHAIASCQSSNTASKAIALLKKIESFQFS